VSGEHPPGNPDRAAAIAEGDTDSSPASAVDNPDAHADVANTAQPVSEQELRFREQDRAEYEDAVRGRGRRDHGSSSAELRALQEALIRNSANGGFVS
jgi:hypothetical protein